MKAYWDDMYLQKKGVCVYPSEDFIRFFKKTFTNNTSNKRNLKVLELGCGMGGGICIF